MPRFSDCWRCGTTVGVGVVCLLCEVAKYCSEKCQKDDIIRHKAECIPASVVRTCNACGKSGRNLKACTGCYRAYYCDSTCQKGNWKTHKIHCITVKTSIQSTASNIKEIYIHSSHERSLLCEFYYWGNVQAFDSLNLIENEGAAYGSDLKILILGVGDLRNVALTCASLPDSFGHKISFTLNDRESCVLARLVLLLYMLKKGDSGIEKKVTEIWYSILLSEASYKSLRTSLEKLVNFTSAKILQKETSGLISMDENHFKQLQQVWKTWLDLRVQGTWWIREQRKTKVNSNSEDGGAAPLGYLENIPTEHAASAKKWCDDGVFKRIQAPAFAENPTLMADDDTNMIFNPRYMYCIPSQALPFQGWDYLEVKKFKSSNCLVTMYGEYIESILRGFINKLVKHQISVKIVLCDCIHIKQHLEEGTVYDRILASNLMDYIFLPDLLKLCSEILNHDNRYATIITETFLWIDDINPEGGLKWPANQRQIPKLRKMALEDTKQTSFAEDDGVSIIEYLDNSLEFFDTLRAIFYTHRARRSKKSDTNPTIPVIKELGNEFQLRLRDIRRNENRIVFPKPAINRRRVSGLEGNERFLEWEPLKTK